MKTLGLIIAGLLSSFLSPLTPVSPAQQPGNREISNEELISRDGHLYTADIAQGRALNKYESAAYHVGSYAIVVNISSEQAEENEALAREFIWEHWRLRKRGYLIVTWHGVDAAYSEHYFIETNPKGAWRIICRGVGANALPPPGIPPQLSDAREIVTVEYVETDRRAGRRRTRAQKVDPRSYSLVLKDKDGNVVDKI